VCNITFILKIKILFKKTFQILPPWVGGLGKISQVKLPQVSGNSFPEVGGGGVTIDKGKYITVNININVPH
jgi:hypothetical protein